MFEEPNGAASSARASLAAGRRDHIRSGGGTQHALGAVALPPLLHQLDQPVPLERTQVVVEALPRTPARAASVVADPGSASAASNRARIGSSEASAAAGSSMTATSSTAAQRATENANVKEETFVGAA